MLDHTKFPLRRSNGSPELRTPDDLLGEAAGDLEQLPGKGKPLNLDTYFKVDAEHRVANQLLSDNGLIPDQLRKRREIEVLGQKAVELSKREMGHLESLRSQLEVAASSFVGQFGSRSDLEKVIGIDHWLWKIWQIESGDPQTHEVVEAGRRLERLITNCNRRRGRFFAEYKSILEQAQTAIRQLNAETVVSRDLPQQIQLPLLDLDALMSDLVEIPPQLDSLPSEWEQRVGELHGSGGSRSLGLVRLWRRVCSRK